MRVAACNRPRINEHPYTHTHARLPLRAVDSCVQFQVARTGEAASSQSLAASLPSETVEGAPRFPIEVRDTCVQFLLFCHVSHVLTYQPCSEWVVYQNVWAICAAALKRVTPHALDMRGKRFFWRSVCTPSLFSGKGSACQGGCAHQEKHCRQRADRLCVGQ